MAFFIVLSAALPASGDGIDEEISRLRKIIEENGYSFTVGRTPLTGLSEEEVRARTGYVPPSREAWDALPKFSPPPANVFGADITDPVFDWRELGAVTEIRNQLLCGSCWAFAAIAQIESQILIHDGVTMDLSEQQMIDCNTTGKDCDGGNQYAAYDVLRSSGAVTESCMPYTQSDGNPCTQAFCTQVAYIDGWTEIANNVTAIKTALLSGPVYTAFRTSALFNSYTSGCFEFDDMREPDHALVIVGWDDNVCDTGAWIVRNHWGTDWGEEGYGYIKYGVSWIGIYATQIQYTPVVEVVSPNGGQTLRAGSEYTVRWGYGSIDPDSISLFYGLGGGGPYDNPIASGITSGTSYLWQVPDISAGAVLMIVRAYLDGGVRAVDVSDDLFEISQDLAMDACYPNPFKDVLYIPYSISAPVRVRVSIHDLKGGLVRVVEDLDRNDGDYMTEWDGLSDDGSAVTPGVYFLMIEAGPDSRTQKIIVLR